jgi:hypothetical protein
MSDYSEGQKTYRDLMRNYLDQNEGSKDSRLMMLLTNIGNSKKDLKPKHDSLYSFLKTYLDYKDI